LRFASNRRLKSWAGVAPGRDVDDEIRDGVVRVTCVRRHGLFR